MNYYDVITNAFYELIEKHEHIFSIVINCKIKNFYFYTKDDLNYIELDKIIANLYCEHYSFRKDVNNFLIKNNLKLDIKISSNVIDFDSYNLIKIHSITLNYCNIISLHMLRFTLHKLCLVCCNCITNISMLDNICEIYISKSNNIKDIGTLRNTIILSTNTNSLYGIHLLKNITTLKQHNYRNNHNYNNIKKLRKIKNMCEYIKYNIPNFLFTPK